MIGFLMDLLVLFFFGPAIAFLALFILLRDIARYYGPWLIPAVGGLTIGIQLQMVGPSDPYATFESAVQVIAGSHIAGTPTPSALIGLGIFSILVKPIYAFLKSLTKTGKTS